MGEMFSQQDMDAGFEQDNDELAETPSQGAPGREYWGGAFIAVMLI
jgi:hypothetical protein